MIGYYIRLALKSFRRTCGLTLLMGASIALGIAVSVATVSVYHLLAGNPIWWKNDRLYAVTMDNWPPRAMLPSPPPGVDLALGPSQLTYQDAMHLFASAIPERKVVMYKTRGVLSGGTARKLPLRAIARVTSADFFAMFDVPFLYGTGWNAAADRAPKPIIVLSKEENQKLFGGEDSVGRTIRWNDREFRVVGVLDDWLPRPKFYDINNGPVLPPEDAYIPWGWGATLELPTAGDVECLTLGSLKTFRDFLNSECNWIQMWVELPRRSQRERMEALMNAYWSDQHTRSRFTAPMNNHLTNVGDWLAEHQVLGDDEHLLLIFGFAFFAVCVVNVVGLVLAKFLGRAGTSGLRRALGANRGHIIVQHITETAVLALGAALVGLALAEGCMWVLARGIALVNSNGAEAAAHMHFDMWSFLWATSLALVAAVAAGLYPAWRVARLPPASYLKSQ
ncbi:MAG TPA: ABC transporter permease [Steroidobacteraceae bacterium]|nr:ABC transporter permease [Steroidobacteraceae bacterium]